MASVNSHGRGTQLVKVDSTISHRIVLLCLLLGAGIVKAIQLPSQALLKIPEHASLDDFSSALSQGNATAVVGSMLSIVADHQGVQHAPLAMLASHCQVGCSTIPKNSVVKIHVLSDSW